LLEWRHGSPASDVGDVADLGERVLREERELGGGRAILVGDLDGFAPRFELEGIGLSEVERAASDDSDHRSAAGSAASASSMIR